METKKIEIKERRTGIDLFDEPPVTGVTRRDVLMRLLAGTMVAGVWTHATAADAIKLAGTVFKAGNTGLSKGSLGILSAVADVIIPRTKTPGAVEAGVPVFINSLVINWMTASERAAFEAGLAALDNDAHANYKRGFAVCPPEQKHAVLERARQAQPFKGQAFSLVDRITHLDAPFFTRLRDLVVFGYFTSEAGSTKELRYVPVPGSFHGNVDMKTWPYQTVI